MSSPPAAQPAPAAHGPLLVVMLGLITAIGPLSLDMYLPAFPALSTDLGVPDAQVQFSLTTCLIGLAVGQLVCGPLSDRWGRRRPLIAGVGAYAVFSFLCALAPNAPVLAGVRLAEGIAGGVGVVVARAIVRDLYAGVAAAKFLSRLVLVFGVAPIAAPSLGSAVLRVTSWHGIFVALGIIATLLLALLVWRMPETLPPARRAGRHGPRGPHPVHRPDLPGVRARAGVRVRRPVQLHLGLVLRAAGRLRRLPPRCSACCSA